jgi:DNA-binding transcriptional regulator LsrR (DeoR family)
VDDAERQLIAGIARRFYFEDMSKTELAKAYGLSRFKIARLLEEARLEGIVKIEIAESGWERPELSAELADHLRLQECIVVRAGETEDANRARLARAAADFIRRQVHEGDVIGFSWGRTLIAIGEALQDLPPSMIVQLTGTVGNDFAQSPVEVIRRIADRSSVRTMAIFSPLFATSEAAARSLREDPAISDAMALYSRLDLAVLSVGSWDPPVTQLAAILPDRDRAELDAERTKAEMAGIFVREDGSLVDAAVNTRRISISPEQLTSTPRVLAVAGSSPKLGAIAAVARSGLITSLITDDLTASELKRLPPVRRQVLSRRNAVPATRP